MWKLWKRLLLITSLKYEGSSIKAFIDKNKSKVNVNNVHNIAAGHKSMQRNFYNGFIL